MPKLTTKYTDAEAIAAADVDAKILTHKNIAGAHHAKYLDSEAVSAMGAKGDANPLHHDKYTDANAVSAIATDDAYVKNIGDTMNGDLIVPTVIGGTGTTSDLTLQTTSGVGEAGADIHFLVGNAGATEAMTILNDGKVGIGITPINALDVNGDLRVRGGDIYLGPSATQLSADDNYCYYNSPDGVTRIYIGASTVDTRIIYHLYNTTTSSVTFRDSSYGTLLQVIANGVVYVPDKIGIGTSTPATSAKLEISSTTGALLLPRMTTAQRDALTAVNGMVLYNSTLNKFQGYENGAWVSLI